MHARTLYDLMKETLEEAMKDDVMSLSAAVAYYAVFSLPPLLVIVLALAGAIFGPEAVGEALVGQARDMAGVEAGEAVQTMLENSSGIAGSFGAKLAGLAALLFGATGAFAQMQASLNTVWDIKNEKRTGFVGLLVKRVLSFGMVLTIAFLLLISLALSAAIGAIGDTFMGGTPPALLEAVNFILSFSLSTLLFAALFVVLPDTRVAWRDTWVGAAFTAGLFAIGKTLIGLYVGNADPASAFGAAGSLALVLIWIYYAGLIVLIGAEFTEVFARRRGSRSWAGNDRALRPREVAPELPKPLPIRG
ncbi:MAG TPA: YihY/virulence factor BrkB family protein [Rhodothermales bacterium]|nr:YihY/virulence factor BrkB family protein [Rhodothermales bacterium]